MLFVNTPGTSQNPCLNVLVKRRDFANQSLSTDSTTQIKSDTTFGSLRSRTRQFILRFESDDGGNHIVLILEVEEPSAPLDDFLRDALSEPKWDGWRYIIKKVPPGYIDAIVLSVKRDDY